MTSTSHTTTASSSSSTQTGRPAQTWAAVLTALLDRQDLSRAAAAWAMGQVVRGDATSAQISGFLTALRAKGETAEEICGFVDALQEQATKVTITGPTVDIVGTGGDRTGAVNISTMASVVVAATGVTVVKHGGRSASSSTCGAADLVEHLGISLDLTPAQVRGWHHIPLRTKVQPRHAARHPGSAGVGSTDRLQHLGPADQPG